MTSMASIRDRYSEAEIKDFYAPDFWQSGTLFDLVAAQADRRPDKVFVPDSTSSLTYRQLHDRTSQLALGAKLPEGDVRAAAVQPPGSGVVEVRSQGQRR